MSGSPTGPETMRATRIEEAVTEAEDITTLYFRDGEAAKASPGQYLMAWVPGFEEVPMSLSGINRNGLSSITVRNVGEATGALCSLDEGDRIGLRGPFGRGFTVEGRETLLVGGGLGTAPLTILVDDMLAKGISPTFVTGARGEGQLLFRERLEEQLGEGLIIATDDGSCGFRGFASECAKNLLDEGGFDSVYTCGPELMMASVFEEAERRGLPVQASLERYIKCAVGLCGSCAIGPYRVCKDGPVFDSDMLRAVRGEFGRRRMDPTGRMVPVVH